MGVLGILFETHDKVIKDGLVKRKQLNKVGRIFLRLTIISGTIALTAQIIEATLNRSAELQKQATDRAVLASLNSQMKLTQFSVHQILRTVNDFDSFKLEVTYDISPTNDATTNLETRLNQLAKIDFDRLEEWQKQEAERLGINKDHMNPIGFNPGLDDLNFGGTRTNWDAIMRIPPNDFASSYLGKELPEFEPLLSSLRRQVVRVVICSKGDDASKPNSPYFFRKPDLSAFSPKVVEMDVTYHEVTKMFSIKWQLLSDKADIHKTKKIISVLDLDKAWVGLNLGKMQLHPEEDYVGQNLGPFKIELKSASLQVNEITLDLDHLDHNPQEGYADFGELTVPTGDIFYQQLPGIQESY